MFRKGIQNLGRKKKTFFILRVDCQKREKRAGKKEKYLQNSMTKKKEREREEERKSTIIHRVQRLKSSRSMMILSAKAEGGEFFGT